jgi:hypothetical protein
LFDGLRLPKQENELLVYEEPAADEDPFFALLEDDSLITHVSIETDMLLQPVARNDFIDPNDVRLVIQVRLRPYAVNPSNENFG